MREPDTSIEPALTQVAAAWDDARTERTLDGVHRKRARRRTRAALAATAAVLIAIGGALAALDAGDAGNGRALRFADGSQAVLLDTAAQVVVERASDTAIDVRLAAGRVRFEVTPRKARSFRVVCDRVVVSVLGTGFELVRDGARTHVQVIHGRVAVTWPSGSAELGAGQAGWFSAAGADDVSARSVIARPMAGARTTPAPADTPAAPSNPEPGLDETAPPRPATLAHASGWRQHAEQGDFQKAYQMLAHQSAHVSDDVEELLLAADAARLSGHAAEAVPYLQNVVDRHADDPRAPLAAFTLGGVLMNQLGRPREAAAAYARARAMSPSSALSQDALARQVEAAHRAADAVAARALALEYLARYPDGRRVQAVRRFGGLP